MSSPSKPFKPTRLPISGSHNEPIISCLTLDTNRWIYYLSTISGAINSLFSEFLTGDYCFDLTTAPNATEHFLPEVELWQPEVARMLLREKTWSRPGNDSIQTNLNSSDNISIEILNLFNNWLKFASFPSHWTASVFFPMHKNPSFWNPFNCSLFNRDPIASTVLVSRSSCWWRHSRGGTRRRFISDIIKDVYNVLWCRNPFLLADVIKVAYGLISNYWLQSLHIPTSLKIWKEPRAHL